ncbi:acidPPc [Geosmithia morbida]|uniref:AcidPPc n=1 Tax=Geosmithia morbida TaxID=1094350 RepID=A0A9P4Z274_9HYPO|nr:acidPPc [Geosmithia morbida]KAF4126340.1 acidPPc [Geosmithia morbida]
MTAKDDVANDSPPDADKRALPKWRYDLRQSVLPLIRWETPYLAWLQEKLRTPALDSYFAITANLGTHTFFMVGLPICFWCGYPALGKGLVHILALGVFWTGFIKDFYSLPRPLSPPLNRITMSGSAALEYGFPSTHSANALSVAVYGILLLHSPDNSLAPTTKLALEVLAYFYSASIVVGRLYCGMHGFLDVVVGSVLGTVISLLEFSLGPPLDEYMHTSSWVAPVIAGVVIVILVRIHPEPADDCPCFDDSVAFAGVVIGLEAGTWTYGRIPNDPWDMHAYGNKTVDVASLGPAVNVARIVLGSLIVFLWRETMKPLLLRTLPTLFRLIEDSGWSLPRRFFTPASEYETVPPGSRLDTMFPSASDFPRMVESIRNPKTRGRSVSASGVDRFEKQMGQVDAAQATAETATPSRQSNEVGVDYGAEGDFDESAVFSKLIKPRVRYDVEVVTKLIVYAGIAWLATALIPLTFELVGLGTNQLESS